MEPFKLKTVLRQLKQRWGPRIGTLVPLNLGHWLLGVEIVLPYYHVVSDQELAHISGLYKFRSLRQFKSDLEFFLRFYTPVSLHDVIHHLAGACRLPKRCFLLTFDDGFREIYDIIAPILYAQGIPAVFFLMTSAIDNHNLCYPQKKSLLIRALASIGDSPITREVSRHLFNAHVKGSDLLSQIRNIYYRQRHVLDELEPILGCDYAAYVASEQPYLTSDQIRALMKRGFDIGAHSLDHPLYSELSLEEQLLQTRESIITLSSRYQYECQSFAFPYTDNGVSRNFFEKSFADGCLKISFGTGGIIPHFYPRNLPRFTMERTDLPAAQILGRQFGRTLFRRPWRAVTKT